MSKIRRPSDLSITSRLLESKIKQIVACSKCNKFPIYTLDSTNPEKVIQYCPICKESKSLKVEDVTEEMLLKLHEVSQNKCQIPEHENEPAVQFCFDCEKWLCQRCKNNHLNDKHDLLSTNIVSEKCLNHSLEYEQFCSQCQLNLCAQCVNDHKDHDIKPLAGLLDLKNILVYQNHRKLIRLHNQQIGLIYQKIKGELEKYIKDLINAFETTQKINSNILELYDIFLALASIFKKNYIVLHNIKNFCTFSFKKFKYEKVDVIDFPKLTVKELNEFQTYLSKSSLIVRKENNNLEEFQKILTVQCPNYISCSSYFKDESNNSEFIVMGFNDGSIALTDINDPKNTLFQVKDKTLHHKGPVLSLLIDGSYIYSGSVDNFIKKWKINRKTKSYEIIYEGRFKGHKGDINKIIKSYDPNQIITCSSDYQVAFWNTNFKQGEKEHGMEKQILFDSGVISIAYITNTNHLLVATSDNKLFLYDVKTQTKLSNLDDIECNYPGCLTERSNDVIVGGGKSINVVQIKGNQLEKLVKLGLEEADLQKADLKDYELTQDLVNIIPEGQCNILFTNSKNRIYKYSLDDGKIQCKEIIRKGKIEGLIKIGEDKYAVVFGKTIEVMSG